MTRSTASPFLSKTKTRASKSSKGTSRPRSFIAEGLFRKSGRPVGPADYKRTSLIFKPSNFNHIASNLFTKQHIHPQKHRRREDNGSEEEPEADFQESRSIAVGQYEVEDDEITARSDSELDGSDEDEQDWLDGSTLIAPYEDLESETEGERAVALVEYLQVPLQEKSCELKQDLCNALIATINDIRQAHVKVNRGADIDRGKGTIHFNDACDKRHVDASCVQAQLKENMAENQIEVKKLFVQLKEAYDSRKRLWIDLKTRIDEITDLQAAVLNQLDDNMARTIAALDKKCKTMLKDDSGRDKEKLLRGVFGKL